MFFFSYVNCNACAKKKKTACHIWNYLMCVEYCDFHMWKGKIQESPFHREATYSENTINNAKQNAKVMAEFSSYISLGLTRSVLDLRVCFFGGSSTMEYIPRGLLSTAVVSRRAQAYHLSTALQGFSRSSGMSLDTFWAFPRHTVFSSDRFLITPFACTSILLSMTTDSNQNLKFVVADIMLNHQPIYSGDTWHEMSLWL